MIINNNIYFIIIIILLEKCRFKMMRNGLFNLKINCHIFRDFSLSLSLSNHLKHTHTTLLVVLSGAQIDPNIEPLYFWEVKVMDLLSCPLLQLSLARWRWMNAVLACKWSPHHITTNCYLPRSYVPLLKYVFISIQHDGVTHLQAKLKQLIS